MNQVLQQKKGFVKDVFNKVFKKYDLMNDLMSLGIHRIWKKNLINMMNPCTNDKLIDVACGTGDIGKLFLNNTNIESKITCVDPNNSMIKKGKEKLAGYNNIEWVNAPAEKIPLADNIFDFYTISFGLRNVKDLNKALSEAYRILKPGGRFLCLEFSKIQNSNLDFVYNNYSKLIPIIGSFVVGEKKPYEYLIESIQNFVNQKELLSLLEKNKFKKCSYRNLTGGIVSIHSGWKY